MKRRVGISTKILILCEGVTEEVYAKALRTAYLPREIQRTVAVEVVRHKQNDPRSLVREAKERIEQARRNKIPYDHVWLFFDHDNSPHLERVFEDIQKLKGKIELAFTAISLEHWFILHFENCGKAFHNGDECLQFLKKHWPDYHKTKINHFTILEKQLDKALSHAYQLENSNQEKSLHNRNPYTTVHKLVEFFKALGTKG